MIREIIRSLIEQFSERPLDLAHGLLSAVLVFDQRETDVFVAVLAEANARRHGHLGFLEQIFGKLD